MAWLNKKRPWYTDGLAFECIECGNCCSGPEEGYVWISPEEVLAAAQDLDMSAEEFTRRYTRRVGSRVSLIEKDNLDCIFLKTDGEGVRHCVVYAVRPMQCRAWPFWPDNLTSSRAWAQAGRRCPGINRGRLHDAGRIEDDKSRTE